MFTLIKAGKSFSHSTLKLQVLVSKATPSDELMLKLTLELVRLMLDADEVSSFFNT